MRKSMLVLAALALATLATPMAEAAKGGATPPAKVHSVKARSVKAGPKIARANRKPRSTKAGIKKNTTKSTKKSEQNGMQMSASAKKVGARKFRRSHI